MSCGLHNLWPRPGLPCGFLIGLGSFEIDREKAGGRGRERQREGERQTEREREKERGGERERKRERERGERCVVKSRRVKSMEVGLFVSQPFDLAVLLPKTCCLPS